MLDSLSERLSAISRYERSSISRSIKVSRNSTGSARSCRSIARLRSSTSALDSTSFAAVSAFASTIVSTAITGTSRLRVFSAARQQLRTIASHHARALPPAYVCAERVARTNASCTASAASCSLPSSQRPRL